MRFSLVSLGLLALTPLTAAWGKDDREIFRVRDEILAYEGAHKTFYEVLGLTPSASLEDITKAYRKLTLALHPDKVTQRLRAEAAKPKKKGGKPGVHVAKPPTQSQIKAAVKKASEEQARLSLIAGVLRGENRERYDHFLANGFPVWKGTGYYYNRYRPGLGTSLFGAFLVGGGACHYLALYLSWKRHRDFAQRYITYARSAAWGEQLGLPKPDASFLQPPSDSDDDSDSDAPAARIARNRKERREQEREGKRKGGRAAPRRKGKKGENEPPVHQRKRIVSPNGKVLIVDSVGDVWLEEEDEDGNVEEFLLDINEIHKPTISDTAVVRLPLWFYGLAASRVLALTKGGKGAEATDEEEEAAAEEDSEGQAPQRTPSSDSAAEDYEFLDKSVDSVGRAKTSGAQGGGGRKRKGKKR